MPTVYTSHLFYLVVVLNVGICTVPDYFIRAYKFVIVPSPSDYLRNIVNRKVEIEEHMS